MNRGCWWGPMLAGLGLSLTGNLAAGDDGTKAEDRAANAAATRTDDDKAKLHRAIVDQFAAIRAEYEAAQWRAREALKSGKNPIEVTKVRPDEAVFSRRMVDLALSAPEDVAARDALLWVLDKPALGDLGPYGDEFGRAVGLLVLHHGDDPEVARLGLQFDKSPSRHRDAFVEGVYAAAQGREAKGLARLALAQFLVSKARSVEQVRKAPGLTKVRMQTYDDQGRLVERELDLPVEVLAYRRQLLLCDADAIRVEAERLFEEVIADYGDLPAITRKHREMEALLKDPSPTLDGEPLKDEVRRRVERILAAKQTLADVAGARLDELHNLAVGKPAPEIDGVDFDGRPLKLSAYRGKVVALVFWGTWCGPCMQQVPHERELTERLKGRPFALLGVDCDGDKEAARRVMKEHGMTWPNWHDGAPGEGPIAKLYHVRGYPTVFVIDGKGVIRGSRLGGGPNLDKVVDDLVKEMESGATRN